MLATPSLGVDGVPIVEFIPEAVWGPFGAAVPVGDKVAVPAGHEAWHRT
jgi:hypothetical protein